MAQMGKMRRWYPLRGDTYRCMTSILSTGISANDATYPNQIPQEASRTEGQKRQRCVILVDDEFFSSQTFTICCLPNVCFTENIPETGSVMLAEKTLTFQA